MSASTEPEMSARVAIHIEPARLGENVFISVGAGQQDPHVGTTLLLATGVRRILGADGHVAGVEFQDDRQISTDVIIVSVGATPNVELATAAGIKTANGIVVDGSLQTSDPAICAIGDCANYRHPHVGQMVRLESVQNAVTHARHPTSVLAGTLDAAYASTAWFWSHQAGQTLQITGIAQQSDDAVVVHEDDQRLTVARVRDGSWWLWRRSTTRGCTSVPESSWHQDPRRPMR